MRPKLVQDLMKTDLIIVDPHATLKEGLRLMKEHNIKSLIVNKGRNGDAYGLLQYRDVAKAIIANDGDMDLMNVYDIATKPVMQVSKQLEAKYVTRLMIDYGIKRILVIDNNELEGFISMSDVLEDFINDALKED